MSDCKQGKYKENTMNDYHLLTHDQLMKENYRLQTLLKKSENDNIELLRAKAKLENELYENKKWTATVYEPNKPTYKELEEKLSKADDLRKKDLDNLWETQITPLQNKVKDQHLQLESIYKRENKHTEEISHLKKIIDRLNTIVNYAAGYISSCEQFRDKHPNDVKNWLFEGLK